jgi:glyoxylase-like metal-dependent hydrolase (beta-lactamase superfamily II)
VWFRQWLSGRDFAVEDPVAAQMANHVYAIGDATTRECVLVDPAYDVAGIVDRVSSEGMRVVGVLATHYHPDHVGGRMMGHSIEGAAELVGMTGVPVHVHADEATWVMRTSGLSSSDLVQHQSGDVVTVGAIAISLLHTPGHTPGSQCFLLDGRLVAGDTLFLDGCGRTDLPGGDPAQLYDSLQLLASLPVDTVVYPGHHYSAEESSSLGSVKAHNMVFKPRSAEEWLRIFG